MKNKHLVQARLGADGKVRRIGPAGKAGRLMRGRVNAALLDSPAAFALDSDTPILTRCELRDLRPAAVDEAPNR